MPNKNTRDPLGHIKLSVSDFNRSFEFYKNLFHKLFYKQVSNKKDRAGWVSYDGFGFSIEQAKNSTHAYQFSAPGIHHFCFKAKSPKEVDGVYNLLLEKQAIVFDPPQKYPDYTKNYYAVFFADPDGIKLEVAYY